MLTLLVPVCVVSRALAEGKMAEMTEDDEETDDIGNHEKQT